MIELAAHPRGTVLPIRAQPNARRDALLGERAGALRVGVSAAPEKGKANASIARVLHEALGLKTSEVTLLSGEASRDKKFLILGHDSESVRGRIDQALASG